ncbi:MAG: hypothetical protein KCHDKBKB_01422 [Elusimicrobia bacterium]|nr:hypothetical protein [Elusimicrobiota bacterium]
MRFATARKLTRFYIINPIGDRRLEQRFDSKESVVLRFPATGRVGPAIAYDIGRHGLRLEYETQPTIGIDVEIAFPNTPDQMRAYGHVVWVRERAFGKYFECGVSISVWHGVINGEKSWMSLKGFIPKEERRKKSR